MRVLKNPKQLPAQHIRVGELLKAEFEKSGIHMTETKRNHFVHINDEIQRLSQEFSMIAYASQETIMFENAPTELIGIQPQLINALIKASSTSNKKSTNAIVPIHSEIAPFILSNAQNPESRRRIYMAMNSGSSSQIAILESLMKKRGELASLLGKESFAHVILGDKMAGSPENVNLFLKSLADTNRSLVDKEVDLVSEIKRAKTGLDEPVNAW